MNEIRSHRDLESQLEVALRLAYVSVTQAAELQRLIGQDGGCFTACAGRNADTWRCHLADRRACCFLLFGCSGSPCSSSVSCWLD